jgi:hypothetical protein
MDLDALRAEIHANADCAAAMAAKDCQAMADIVSAGRVRLAPRLIGVGAVMSALGGVRGAQILKSIQGQATQNPMVEFAWMLLDRGALDIGDAETHAQLDILAGAGMMTSGEAGKLKALGMAPDPVSAQDVARAVFHDDGTLK